MNGVRNTRSDATLKIFINKYMRITYETYTLVIFNGGIVCVCLSAFSVGGNNNFYKYASKYMFVDSFLTQFTFLFNVLVHKSNKTWS